ncbi:carbohydrate esterase family 4 protein [Mycena maculata]|uniref:Carbohydrate esterase family 4 protein n=1 Tax=Mycena maculata TaxID=230809 RepID=A0AAD7JBX6_9AGAR|nr:carbohydrate esterase family 4 protein [Mycena maculata]
MLGKSYALFLSAVLASAVPLIDPTAAPNPPKAALFTSCTVNGTMALTFDDGPYLWQKNMSDLLTQYNAKGTFFVNGYNWDCIYDEPFASNIQYTYQAGHQICAHTWSHPDLTTLNATRITQEFNKIDTALYNILGIKTDWVRPPYGSYNTAVRQQAYTLNKTLVTWDFECVGAIFLLFFLTVTRDEDSEGATAKQSMAYYDQFLAQNPLPPTGLMLNHETYNTTVFEVMPYAIPKLVKAGYKLVTLAECMGVEPYTYKGPLGTRDSTWVCPEENN